MKNLLAYARRLKRLSRTIYPHEPLIKIELSRERLLHNLDEFRKIAPRPNGSDIGRVAPVLKSNAYGHGLFEIADILEEENRPGHCAIPFFVVDSYFEADALRGHGIKTPILVAGYSRPETIAASPLKNVAFAVTNIETLRSLAKLQIPEKKKIRLHLKIDTGMRRQGILPAEMGEAAAIFRKNQRLELEGALTHFSDANNADHSFTERQIKEWNDIARRLKSDFPSIKYTHAAATDGHPFTKKIEANVSRLGIGLYGLSDDLEFARKMNLKPVLRMKTIVTGVKKIKAGETVGYGNSFTAWKDTLIATIPVGYFEGLNRKLSNNGSVVVDGIACPIIGRVSMNMTTIEIPADKNSGKQVHIGSPVIAISDNASDQNSIASIAKRSGTITYEIAAHIPAHLKKIVI